MGLRKAINDKCKECTYDVKDKGTWREQVEMCHISTCPLWSVRPRSSGTRAQEWAKAADTQEQEAV